MKSLRIIAGILLAIPAVALASASSSGDTLDLTTHTVGYLALAVFVLAYAFVMLEEVSDERFLRYKQIYGSNTQNPHLTPY